MPVHVGFYVPATYHAIFGRFFKDPGDIKELEREYSDYLVRRLTLIRDLQSRLRLNSVRVEPGAFFSHLAAKGLDATRLTENETSQQLSMFSATLQPSLFPIVERLQDLQQSSGIKPDRGTITRFHPSPGKPDSHVPQDLVVGIALVITSQQGGSLGRYFVWIDGDYSVTDSLKVLEQLCSRIPELQVFHAKRPEPLHLCSCCRLPQVVCMGQPPAVKAPR